MLQLPLDLHAGRRRPLYRQLYNGLAGQIRAGALAAGMRLPGKRTLAGELGISVNTVDTAYQMLAAEGYIESRPRSGFVVVPFWDLSPAADAGARRAAVPMRQADRRPQDLSAAPPPAGTRQLPAALAPDDARGAAQTAGSGGAAAGTVPVRFDLATANIDTALFPFRTWGRIQKELLYSSPELLSHGDGQGDAELRRALAVYLAAYRGVRCTPDQIIVGAGQEYLLGMLAPLLCEAGAQSCAVEDPGYAAGRTVLVNSGLPCLPLPVDSGGLSLAALTASSAGACYVTPSHQFPTGVTMPAPRRAALLRWAAAVPGRCILEDDYDSEFRFDQKPLPSLQGMAGENGPVVYLSTVSKSLAPSIRIAYMVLPEPLLGAWRARCGSYASTVSRFEQQTLRRFLEEGYFTRHLARMRNTCKARRNALVQALYAAFGRSGVQLAGLHTGLHLLLTLPDGPSETQMLAAARAAGVRLNGLSGYYVPQRRVLCPPRTVVLGYGSLLPEDAPALASTLKNCWSCASVPSSNS